MSDFIEVAYLRDEAVITIVEACKEMFARHGIPRILHSDNALYYVSMIFEVFEALEIYTYHIITKPLTEQW